MSSFPKKLILVITFSLALLAFFVIGGNLAYIKSYDGKAYPGIRIGAYDVGGLTQREVVNLLETLNNRYAKEGIDLVVENASSTQNKVKVSTVQVEGETAVEIVNIDSQSLSSEVMKIGRVGDWFQQTFFPLYYRFNGVAVPPKISVNEIVLERALKDKLQTFEDQPREAGVKNVNENGFAEIVKERSGSSFDYQNVKEKIKRNILNLSFSPISIKLKEFSPTITYKEVEQILPKLKDVISAGSIEITNTSSPTATLWILEPDRLSQMVEVGRKDRSVVFTLNRDGIIDYLKTEILPRVEIPAVDARFVVENNKVKEFGVSKNGVGIDNEKMVIKLKDIFEQRNSAITPGTTTVELDLVSVPARIQSADLNDFGILELLGSGSSTFKDSHSRRIKNIAHAVERLHGTLIQPGEEFSANKSAGPFTIENGYLPEAIIKGRQIVDEVGGGMCQIGTTLFRMAMQTGLPIVQRQNHSLVVSYYADPVNGNPGTDATLYEPYLDFKFLNDTGNYLLLTTEIDYKKQLLLFSLWGTKDGRQGSYTRPKVSKWIPYPQEVEYIASRDGKLKVGEEKCQPAYRGAVASFTYTRVTPEGEKIDRVFDSYYRPLPKICTVGVDPLTCPAGEVCLPSSIPKTTTTTTY